VLTGEEEAERLDLLYTGAMNSALCSLKLEDYYSVVRSAQRALQLRPSSVKALYRKGVAHIRLKEYSQGAQCLQKVLQLDPQNKAAAKELQTARMASKKSKLSEVLMCQRMFSSSTTTN